MPDPNTIGSFLADVGSIFTEVISMVGETATKIANTPILLIFCVLPLVGLGVGMFKRLLSTH